MSAVSIKVSKLVANAARKAAEVENRSLTGQIEHWVRLGIQAEEQLTGSARTVLKIGADDAPEADLAEIRQLLAELSQPGVATQRSEELTHKVRYELDSENEDVVIEVSPDGKRRRGSLKGREFFPFQTKPSILLDNTVFHLYSVEIQPWTTLAKCC